MSRISRDDLRHRIYVAIRCAPKLVLGGLRAKLPIEGDKATAELTELICGQIDNERFAVVRIADDPGIPFEEFCSAPPRKD